MRRAALCIAGSILWAVAAGCENPFLAIDWERMIDQPRGKPYKSSPYFADGRLMQPPPAGVVPIDRPLGPAPFISGLDTDGYARAIPVPLNRAVLRHGENRYDVFCAVCHGVDGSGDSIVANHMPLRKPPSLLVDPVRSFAPGRVFQVITVGYGLMPSYAMELSLEDRWAVVGYLRALQLRSSTELKSLPESVRHRAEDALR